MQTPIPCYLPRGLRTRRRSSVGSIIGRDLSTSVYTVNYANRGTPVSSLDLRFRNKSSLLGFQIQVFESRDIANPICTIGDGGIRAMDPRDGLFAKVRPTYILREQQSGNVGERSAFTE